MYHFTFMYFSVIGLYAAFASEILTRIPEPFFHNGRGRIYCHYGRWDNHFPKVAPQMVAPIQQNGLAGFR